MIEEIVQPEVKAFIKGHLKDDPFQLLLRKPPSSDFPQKQAIEQIHARQKALKKLPAWAQNMELVMPPPLSVEQSSSQIAAKFKAELISGNTLADLSGGMGVDTCAFSHQFKKVCYVERESSLCQIAKYNFGVLNKQNIEVFHQDAQAWMEDTKEQPDWVYLDPARRNVHKNRVFRLEDCSPNLLELLPVIWRKSKHILVKLSPLVSIPEILNMLKGVQKVWVVAIQNECKELLIALQNTDCEDVSIEAVNIKGEQREVFSFQFHDEKSTKVELSMPLQYIYEPNVAILKAGAFKSITGKYDVLKLSANSHLYTSKALVSDFPGRIFELKHILKPSKKEIKRQLSGEKANVTVRNFPETVDQLRKKWGVKEGGDQYLFATTLLNGKKAVLYVNKSN